VYYVSWVFHIADRKHRANPMHLQPRLRRTCCRCCVRSDACPFTYQALISSGYTGTSCTACLAGTYKPVTGPADCFDCLTIAGVSELTTDLTARTSNNDCICQKGYTSQLSTGCASCITGVRARVAEYFYKVTFQVGTATSVSHSAEPKELHSLLREKRCTFMC
jgi:hypothetical protein